MEGMRIEYHRYDIVEAEIKMLELLQSDDESQHGEEKASEEKADGLNSNLADKLADIFS